MSIPPLIPRFMGPLDHRLLPPLDAGEVIPVGRSRQRGDRWRGVLLSGETGWLVEYRLLTDSDREVLRGLTAAELAWARRPTLDAPESLLGAVLVGEESWRPVPEIEALLDPFGPDDDTTEEVAAPAPPPGLGGAVLRLLRGGS